MGNLHDQNGLTVVEFRLGFDEGEWRVWGMEEVNRPEDNAVPVAEEKPLPLADQLAHVVQKLHGYLRHQDVYEVYEQMMSEEYRGVHSRDDFIAELANHPVLLDYSASYLNRVMDKGDLAELRGTVMTLDGKTHPVRYTFVQEDGVWKVKGLQVLEQQEPIAQAEHVLDAPKENLPPNPPKIVALFVGTEITSDGIIKQPMNVLPSNTDLIYFNAVIRDALPKMQVMLSLEHVESGSSAPELTTVVEERGNPTIVFSFAAPEEGWPPGDYVAKVTLSTGEESIQKFTINKK